MADERADLTLDVVMDNFWTRPTGVYGKSVWLRPGVLQVCSTVALV